jgi:phospho-N-acetylmuramoyl-pentapeptide-transferase
MGVNLATLLIGMAIGFVVALVAGKALLALVPRFQFRQIAYEDAPASHQSKTGTPTLGGLAILASMLPAFFNFSDLINISLLGVVFGCGAIGFVDDYLSIRRGKNLGLPARTKYLLTALVAVAFLRLVAAVDYPVSMGTPVFPLGTIFHAGSFALTVPFWLWMLLGIVAVTGTVHAVNLADGLDGLAAGTVIPPVVVCLIIALNMYYIGWSIWPPLVLSIGGIFGFLVYNRHPARMFMGDTGSLALGALLASSAILTGEMLLLILIGGVFVAEALSVIIQVTYFKRTGGKRVFRMTPLHHHFELVGWPETAVTARFWLASVFLSGLGLAIVR